MSKENDVKLADLLAGKSEEWREGFFAGVNFSPETKAAFLRLFIGSQVAVEFADGKPGC